MSVASIGSSSKACRQFDVIVFPRVACKLAFEVIKNQITSGVKQKDVRENYSKWKGETALVKKPTTISLTIPAGATHCQFIALSEQGKSSTTLSKDFKSIILEVCEERNSFGIVVCRIIPYPKLNLPADADKQTISIGVSEGSSDSTAAAKDAVENKAV